MVQGASNQWRGLFLLFLVLGGEASRVHNELKGRLTAVRNSVGSKQHVSEVDNGGLGSMQTAAGEYSGDIEVVRGWLQYKDYVMCSVLRRSTTEPSIGRLEMYREQDLEQGCEGFIGTKKPHRTLLFRPDDAVMLERHHDRDTFAATGEKFYWDKSEDGSPNRKTMFFSPVEAKLSVHLMGEKRWRTIGSAREAASMWLNAIRMLQATGVECLNKGTCLVQCTYVESLDGCSSDFCTLENKPDVDKRWANFTPWWSGRPRCTPKEGAAASLGGWEALKKTVIEHAEWVYKTGCVLHCQNSWREINRHLHLANELSREFDAVQSGGLDTKIPQEMQEVLRKIKSEAMQLSALAAGKVGEGFDFTKNKPTLLRQALRSKGCEDLPDGSMQALYRLDAAPQGKSLDEAQAAFRSYQDACPWIAALSRSPEAAIEEVEAAQMQHGKQMEDSRAGRISKSSLVQESSLVQQSESDSLTPDVIFIAAIIASSITIASGVVMLVGGAFCSPSHGASKDNVVNASIAHNHCKTHLKTESSCWQSHMLPGIYVIIGGFVMLGITGVAVAAVGNSALISDGAIKVVEAIGVGGTVGFTSLQAFVGVLGKSVGAETLLEEDKSLSAEDQYVKCMTKIRDHADTQLIAPPANASTPEIAVPPAERQEGIAAPVAQKADSSTQTMDSVEGLEELFQEARIRAEIMEQFRSELVSYGVIRVSEVQAEDWENLVAWPSLSLFERRRLEAILDTAGHASVKSVKGLDELFAGAELRPEVLDKFRYELIANGITDVSQVQFEDWESLSAWVALSTFEKRRLKAVLPESVPAKQLTTPEPSTTTAELVKVVIQDASQAPATPVTASTVPRVAVKGLAQLFIDAKISAEVLEKFNAELVGLGVIDIDEVDSQDWPDFQTWPLLSKYEAKRFTATLARVRSPP